MPQLLSAKLLSIHGSFTLYWCMKLFLPGCSIIHFPLLNLIKFISHFSCLSPEWQHTYMVFQLLLPVLPHLQIVWRCIPTRHQVFAKNWLLQYATRDWLPDELHVIYDNSWSLAAQLVCSPPHCPLIQLVKNTTWVCLYVMYWWEIVQAHS